MAELKELDLEMITNNDGTKTAIAVLFTLTDDYLEGLSEKKFARTWNTFNRKYGRDNEKKEYYVVNDKGVLTDSDVYQSKEYVMTSGLDVLAHIDEKDKGNLDFGLRIQIEDMVYPLDETLTRDLSKEELNHGLTYDDVEEQYYELKEYLEQRIEEKRLKDEAESERQEKEAEKLQNEPENKQKTVALKKTEKEYSLPKDIEENLPEDKKYEDQTEEEHTMDNVEPEEEIEETEEEVEQEIYNQYDDLDDGNELEHLKRKVYKYINDQIPYPNLNSVDVNNVLSRVDYKGYKDLYVLTQDSIVKRLKQQEYELKQKRQKIVNEIYRSVESEVVKRYNRNESLVNYTDDENEFSHIYKTIEKDYKAAIDSLESHRTQKEMLLNDQYNVKKKEYVERETRKAEIEFERANLPRINEEVERFVDELRTSANESKEQQIEQLENDIYSEMEQRNSTLVDNVIKDFKPTISNYINEYSKQIEVISTELTLKIENELGTLQERVISLEEKRIKAEKLSDEKINAAVEQRTADYKEKENRIHTLEDEIYSKNKSIRDIEQELMRKEALIEQAIEERKRVAQDKEYYMQNEANLRKEIDELRSIQMEAMKDFSNNPTHNIRAASIENKKNNGEKLTFSDRLNAIDRKIYNFIGAVLVSASLLGGAALVGGGDVSSSEDNKQLQELEKKVQSQESKQKEIEEKANKAEQEKQQAQEAQKKAEQEKQQAQEAQKKAEQEKSKDKKKD
ncbi:hypothetical protein [Mammaliicoccus sciuri]|uniref:hypothetical protein n=1 Tax=Mammaliicoccus sciuri TaxID=1296 RepID=UPI00374F2746